MMIGGVIVCWTRLFRRSHALDNVPTAISDDDDRDRRELEQRLAVLRRRIDAFEDVASIIRREDAKEKKQHDDAS
jgi:hypothetical protein